MNVYEQAKAIQSDTSTLESLTNRLGNLINTLGHAKPTIFSPTRQELYNSALKSHLNLKFIRQISAHFTVADQDRLGLLQIEYGVERKFGNLTSETIGAVKEAIVSDVKEQAAQLVELYEVLNLKLTVTPSQSKSDAEPVAQSGRIADEILRLSHLQQLSRRCPHARASYLNGVVNFPVKYPEHTDSDTDSDLDWLTKAINRIAPNPALDFDLTLSYLSARAGKPEERSINVDLNPKPKDKLPWILDPHVKIDTAFVEGMSMDDWLQAIDEFFVNTNTLHPLLPRTAALDIAKAFLNKFPDFFDAPNAVHEGKLRYPCTVYNFIREANPPSTQLPPSTAVVSDEIDNKPSMFMMVPRDTPVLDKWSLNYHPLDGTVSIQGVVSGTSVHLGVLQEARLMVVSRYPIKKTVVVGCLRIGKIHVLGVPSKSPKWLAALAERKKEFTDADVKMLRVIFDYYDL
jgi:hypothetical protein